MWQLSMMKRERFLRLMQRGAMVIMQGEFCDVYRSTDVRRGKVGCVAWSCVEACLADGLLKRHGAAEHKYVLKGGLIPKLVGAREQEVPSHPNGGGEIFDIPPRLNKLLGFETNRARRVRLVKAAVRFSHAFEASNCGRQYTMNWAFVPRGSGRGSYGSREGGFANPKAREAMKKLSDILGPDNMFFLTQVLVFERSAAQVCFETGIGRRAFRQKFRQAVIALAEAYDHKVAARDAA